MTTNRLEAFTDGVLAIVITVMVLEFKPPSESGVVALSSLVPEIGTYLLSFVMVGIYWNNHHHMMHAVKHISGSVMWANLHLLFWLSLLPFATEWIRDASFVGLPVGFAAIVLFMSGVAYWILEVCLVKVNGKDSAFAKALGPDYKGKLSVLIYAVSIVTFWWFPYFACALFILVAMMWFVPDSRFAHHRLTEE